MTASSLSERAAGNFPLPPKLAQLRPAEGLQPMPIAKLVSALLLCGVLYFFAAPSPASAQSPGRFAVGADYNFVHANAPPGECGCFNLNGGDVWVGWHLTDHISVVGQGAVQHAKDIDGTTAGLTLTSFLAGPRVNFHTTHRFTPFAQGLFGIAHATGSLTPSSTTGLLASANAFAFEAGGGLDFTLTRSFSLRAIQADYFYTRFENGVNQRQNNLRLSAGLIFHF